MIYVDEINTTLPYTNWCHMWSDECDQELHEMADRIGLRREWFQAASMKATNKFRRYYNHYDVTPAKRAMAIRLGATPITIRDYIEYVDVRMGGLRP